MSHWVRQWAHKFLFVEKTQYHKILQDLTRYQTVLWEIYKPEGFRIRLCWHRTGLVRMQHNCSNNQSSKNKNVQFKQWEIWDISYKLALSQVKSITNFCVQKCGTLKSFIFLLVFQKVILQQVCIIRKVLCTLSRKPFARPHQPLAYFDLITANSNLPFELRGWKYKQLVVKAACLTRVANRKIAAFTRSTFSGGFAWILSYLTSFHVFWCAKSVFLRQIYKNSNTGLEI